MHFTDYYFGMLVTRFCIILTELKSHKFLNLFCHAILIEFLFNFNYIFLNINLIIY